MICYKDRTWCNYYTSCLTPCERALTPQVMEDAEKWMKNAPICKFASKPKCYKTKDDKI